MKLFFSNLSPTISETVCFGVPKKPENMYLENNGNSLVLRWTKPQNANGLEVCYYNVQLPYSRENSTNYKTIQNFFPIPENFQKQFFEIGLSSFFDVECYKNKNPVALKCELMGKINARSDTVRLEYRPSSPLSTLATKSPNSSNRLQLSSVIVLIEFFLFYLFFWFIIYYLINFLCLMIFEWFFG